MSTTTPHRILLVEDSPTQRAQACYVLESAGFEVTPASSLAEGCEAARGATFDAIVLDLVLPDASELEALLQLRSLVPQIPIVVQTSLEDEHLALRALHEGAQDYLTKGVIDSSALLVRTVRHAIERGRHQAELQKLTDVLRSQNDELAALNAQKDRFLGIAAHDLRNPLGIVLGYTELLLGGTAGRLTADQRQILSTVRASAQYMLGLLEDLLELSAIQAHGIMLHPERTDLPALLRETVALQRMLATPKEIDIELGSIAEVAEMELDARKIRQVLENLLTNAVKFSHPHSTVTVSLHSTNDHVVLEVEDHGVGIPATEIPMLFRPFSRTSVRGTSGERSTGLGLAIVYNIVVAHGGRIEVSSEPGHGSVFRVLLPLRPR